MNCKSNPSAVSCKECMGNAPYKWCCQDECGEHEFCRGCERRKEMTVHCEDEKCEYNEDGLCYAERINIDGMCLTFRGKVDEESEDNENG